MTAAVAPIASQSGNGGRRNSGLRRSQLVEALNGLSKSKSESESSKRRTRTRAPPRLSHSFTIGAGDADAAARIQDIMYEKVKPGRCSSFTTEKKASSKPQKHSSFYDPKQQSSFHLPQKQTSSSFHHDEPSPTPKRSVAKAKSFHEATSSKKSTVKKSVSFHTEVSSVMNPSTVNTRPKSTSKSNRPIAKRPVEKKLPIGHDLPHIELPFEASKKASGPAMQVIDLPWQDLRGSRGKYTGKVNTHIQPHGFGSLKLEEGTTISGKWYNGTPLDERRSRNPSNAAEKRQTKRNAPHYQINENDKHVRYLIELPGVKPDDMFIELKQDGRIMHMMAGRKMDKSTEEYRFEKRFILGRELDTSKITAHLAHGVLCLTIPKKEHAQPTKQKITVTHGEAPALIKAESWSSEESGSIVYSV